MKSFLKQVYRLPTGSQTSVKINRIYAARFRDTGRVDHEGKATVFGQLYQQCLKNSSLYQSLKQNSPESHFWSTNIIGEGSSDAGGPFREMLTNVAQEIESTTLPLMIKTTNNRSEWGFSRECWTLNPDANSPTHQELFKFMGRFVGFSIRSGAAMDWHFTPILWKQIKDEKVVMKDFESFDNYALQAFTHLQTMAQQYAPEDFDAGVDETFTTILSNTKQVPICPGGEKIQVTHQNYQDYIQLSMQARLDEAKNQLKWLKEGINEIITLDILSVLSWDDLEKRACGGDIQAEALQSITTYCGCNKESQVIQWFWKMFEEWDQVDRKNYLKFAWGRSKLPFDLASASQKHKIELYRGRNPKSFPKSHTCFFTTDIPEYRDYDVMVERITTAIQTCGEIDDDGGPNGDYGHQLDEL